ncbi:uncharacterized protein LAJ45_08491 [Morchella importuna]|uniref:uncharacterized protein n=1 Tax=Morchella importuna TaxID=1174673 RepID=UPI001E8D69BB|nr:uncharacterized protein LAJ45_08491 [Morchella importuna]KAH8147335.1 hypothetical protein LAJ45_08491 [Morchella importuna]
MRYTSPEDDPKNHNKFLTPISGNRGADPASESRQLPNQSVPKIWLNYQNSHVTQFRCASGPNPGAQAVQFHPSHSARSFSPNSLSRKTQGSTSSPTLTDIPPQKTSSVASSTAGDYYFLASGLILNNKSDIPSNDSTPKPYQQYLLQSSKPTKPSLASSRIPSVGSQQGSGNIPSNSTSNLPSHQSISRSVSLQYSSPLEAHTTHPHQSSHFAERREAKLSHSAVPISVPISVSTAEYRPNPPPGLYESQYQGDSTSIIPTTTQNIKRQSMPKVDCLNVTGNMQHNVFQNGRRSVSTGDFPGQIHGILGIQDSQYPNPQYLQVPGQNAPPTMTHMGPINPVIMPHQPIAYPGYVQHHGYQQQQQQPIHTARQHINMQIQHLQLQQQHIRMQQHQIQIQQHQNHIPQQQQQQQMANAYPAHQLHPQQTQQLQAQPQFGQYDANGFQY